MRTEPIVRTYRQIAGDYAYDASPFSGDTAKVRRIKRIIGDRLTASDRTIIILYAELGSYRKLGRRLGLSHTTVRKEVLRIRDIVKAYL